MSNPSDCAKSISAMVKEWTQPVLAGGINIPPNLIDRRMARFEPSPALAALAMRERAADMIDAGGCTDHVRALPTTFTDAELLAAAMQLPEVRALVDALDAMLFNALHGNGLEAHYKARDDARAALAPFMKGAG